MNNELASGLRRFSEKAAAGYILDVTTGEIIALSSIESDTSHPPATGSGDASFNRVTQSVYEIGTSAKLMTIAMALDAGKAGMASRIDARSELHYGRFTIHDDHPQRRMLTVPEVALYSSNIATARLAERVGTAGQRAFLEKMNQLDRPAFDGIDGTAPVIPKEWTGFETLAASFGGGLAVSPLQAGMAIAAMVNGGTMVRPTIFKRSGQASGDAGERVISSGTSAKIRYLLRLNAEKGTGTQANVPGYFVGGATSTTNKIVNGEYAPDRVIAIFTAVYPADRPKYLLMTMLDDPQGLPETHGFKTADCNAAAIAAKVIEETAPILGVEYRAAPPATPSPM